MQGDGYGNDHGCTCYLYERLRWCTYSGRYLRTRRLWRDLRAQHPCFRCYPTDLSYHGSLRRWCRLLSALTDFIIMKEQTSYMFLTGPKVVKTVTGEDIDAEHLGGASVHATKSGVTHFAAKTEEEAIEMIKSLLSYIPSNNTEEAPRVECTDPIDRMDDSLNEIIPEDPNRAYDMYKVIGAVTDNGEFFEVQPKFAKNIITGFARFNGQSVGIVANQPSAYAGVLDVNASRKAARFVRFCDAFNIPIVSLVDVPGFLPCTQVRSTMLSSFMVHSCSTLTARLPCQRSLSHCVRAMVVATS